MSGTAVPRDLSVALNCTGRVVECLKRMESGGASYLLGLLELPQLVGEAEVACTPVMGKFLICPIGKMASVDMNVFEFVLWRARQVLDTTEKLIPIPWREVVERMHWNVDAVLERRRSSRHDPLSAVRLGDCQYEICGEKLRLTDNEDRVIEALIECGALTKDRLEHESAVSRAHEILAGVRRKHPSLAPYIVTPGKKGAGGYRTTIINAEAEGE